MKELHELINFYFPWNHQKTWNLETFPNIIIGTEAYLQSSRHRYTGLGAHTMCPI